MDSAKEELSEHRLIKWYLNNSRANTHNPHNNQKIY
jgi:hypothetical protein